MAVENLRNSKGMFILTYPNLTRRKGVVQVEKVSLDDFNVQAGAKETINYQVDENGNRI